MDYSFDEDQDCLLYTSDAADERSSVDLGGRRIIKKKNTEPHYAKCLILTAHNTYKLTQQKHRQKKR